MTTCNYYINIKYFLSFFLFKYLCNNVQWADVQSFFVHDDQLILFLTKKGM